jgi:hypothetical protein
MSKNDLSDVLCPGLKCNAKDREIERRFIREVEQEWEIFCDEHDYSFHHFGQTERELIKIVRRKALEGKK